MAVKRTLVIKATNTAGDEVSTTLVHTNPSATNTQIDTVCRAINGLTKNTYVDTVKVETESVNEALAEEGD